jgi:hypothetical protein
MESGQEPFISIFLLGFILAAQDGTISGGGSDRYAATESVEIQ